MANSDIKHKVLLVGKAEKIISGFFSRGSKIFQCATSSLIPADLETNLKYFQPDVVVYCMGDERKEHMRIVSAVETPLVIIGSQFDYDLYFTVTKEEAGLYLQNSDSFSVILETLSAFVKKITHSEEDTMPEERKRIMVIDDSPIMQRALISMLKADYDIMTAISGKVAMRYLQNKTVDLIFLDYEMADENGPDVFTALKANPATSDIPVVFLTGVTDANKIREVLALKPNGYLIKPVERSVLVDKIQEVLQEAASYDFSLC